MVLRRAMTLDECDALFERIRNSRSFEDTKRALRLLMSPSVYTILNADSGGRSILWRGRRCKDAGGYANVSELTFPPPERTPAGRLNDRDNPCLYAATKVETVFAELDLRAGEFVQVVGFRIYPDVTVRLIALGELYHVYRSGFAKTLGHAPSASVAQYLNELGFDSGLRTLYVDAFLSQELGDPRAGEDGYRTTRAIAAIAYETVRPAEGFFFPSVKASVGTNVTIKPDAFYNKYRVICSRVIRIQRTRRFGFFEHEAVNEAAAVRDDGSFLWRPPIEERRGTFFNLTKHEAEQDDKGGVF
jgi:hypothetical protein